jgi:hypothetical protein
MYEFGIIFVDEASGCIQVKFQVGLLALKTIWSKMEFTFRTAWMFVHKNGSCLGLHFNGFLNDYFKLLF